MRLPIDSQGECQYAVHAVSLYGIRVNELLLTWNEVLFCIGSMCQALANSIPFLTLGRAIGGVGIGALR